MGKRMGHAGAGEQGLPIEEGERQVNEPVIGLTEERYRWLWDLATSVRAAQMEGRLPSEEEARQADRLRELVDARTDHMKRFAEEEA